MCFKAADSKKKKLTKVKPEKVYFGEFLILISGC